MKTSNYGDKTVQFSLTEGAKTVKIRQELSSLLFEMNYRFTSGIKKVHCQLFGNKVATGCQIKCYYDVKNMTGEGEEWLLSIHDDVIARFIDGYMTSADLLVEAISKDEAEADTLIAA